MERFDKYLTALWTRYGLPGVLIVVAATAGLIWLSGVDVAAIVNGWLGL